MQSTCERYKSPADFVTKMTLRGDAESIVTSLLSDLNKDWFKIDNSCKEKKNKIENKIQEGAKKGIECLLKHGDKSINDALGLIGIFFLKEPLKVSCKKEKEKYKVHTSGKENCIEFPEFFNGLMHTGIDEFPFMVLRPYPKI